HASVVNHRCARAAAPTMRMSLVILCLEAALSGCGEQHSSSVANPCTGTPPPLRCLAAARGLAIGSAVNDDALTTDPTYPSVAAPEFNIATPENEMKWAIVHPERARYDFTRADAISAFAQAHHMEVHGHTLAWHQQNPTWLTTRSFGRDESIAILQAHI